MNRSKALLTFFVLAAALNATTPTTIAGTIFVSGDTNLGNGIDGSSGAPLSPGNRTWFDNILGPVTTIKTVKIQNESSFGGALTTSLNALNTYYGGTFHVWSNFFTGTITDDALQGVDLFISVMPRDDYTASETQALARFLRNGGSLFFMGENDDAVLFQNARINACLASLGSAMALDTTLLSPGFHTTSNLDADPLNAGVGSIAYAGTSAVVAGTSLLRTADENVTFVAYETIVPEPSSIALAAIALLGLIAMGRRQRAPA